MRLGFKIDVVVDVPEGASREQTIEGVKAFLDDTDRDTLFLGNISHGNGEEDEGIPVVSTEIVEDSIVEIDEHHDAG